MQFNGNDLIFFDIETGGFSAVQDPFIVSVALKEDDQYIEHTSLEELYDFAKNGGFNGIIVTYNGENYQGGFDFPFLRTKYALKRMDFPFRGLQHLDLLPLIKKYFNTTDYIISIPSKNSSTMNKKNLSKLAFANGLEYKNINDTYDELLALHEEGKCDWLNFAQIKPKEDNSLQAVYQLFFDYNAKEEYIPGEAIPELYEQGDMQSIIRHCCDDVRMLKEVAKFLLPMIPSWDIERNISRL